MRLAVSNQKFVPPHARLRKGAPYEGLYIRRRGEARRAAPARHLLPLGEQLRADHPAARVRFSRPLCQLRRLRRDGVDGISHDARGDGKNRGLDPRKLRRAHPGGLRLLAGRIVRRTAGRAREHPHGFRYSRRLRPRSGIPPCREAPDKAPPAADLPPHPRRGV